MSDFVQKLTIQAEALGLPEAARGVELVDAAQKKLIETQKGLEQARLHGTLDDVEELTKKEAGLTKVIETMTGKNNIAAESMGNFGEQLKRFNPLLGEIVGAMTRYNGVAALVGVAIAGITSAARTMREEWERTTKAIQDQADALTKIKGQESVTQQGIEDMRASSKSGGFRSAAESSSAMDLFNRVRREHPWITDESAVSTAAGFGQAGGLSVEGTAGIARLIQTNPESMQDVAGISRDQMPSYLREQLRLHAPQLNQDFELERQQKAMRSQAAAAQLRRQGGSTLELQEVIAGFAPSGANLEYLAQLAQELQTPERVDTFEGRMRAGMGIPGAVTSAIGAFVPGASSPIWNASPSDFGVVRSVMREIQERTTSPAGQGPRFGSGAGSWKIGDLTREIIHEARQSASWPAVSEEEDRKIDRILGGAEGDVESQINAARKAISSTTHLRGSSLDKEVGRIRRGVEAPNWMPDAGQGFMGPPARAEGNSSSSGTVINNHYDQRSYNARNVAPFATGQASAIRNGETRARDLEMFA